MLRCLELPLMIDAFLLMLSCVLAYMLLAFDKIIRDLSASIFAFLTLYAATVGLSPEKMSSDIKPQGFILLSFSSLNSVAVFGSSSWMF